MSVAIWLKIFFYEHLWMFKWKHKICVFISKSKNIFLYKVFSTLIYSLFDFSPFR